MMPTRSSLSIYGVLLVSVAFLAMSQNAWAQVPEYYDGVVSEPAVRVWFDTSTGETHVVAAGESWGAAADGNVRLEASFSYKGRSFTTPPRTVTLALVRVGTDEVWKKSTRFKVLADGVPMAVTFSSQEAYEVRGVKIGVEETLWGRITAADLKRLSKARRAQVKIDKESYDLSQQAQTKLAELIDQPHSAPVSP